MKELKVVTFTVQAFIEIDEDEWPDGWDIKQEIGHQLTIDEAVEYEIELVSYTHV